MTRSTTKIIIALAAALAVAVSQPQRATAGEYTIAACQADDAGYVSSAFENFATRGMKWRRACNPLGPGLRGLVTANVPGSGRVPRGAQSGFVLKAPPETTFSRLRWSGQAQRRDCRYALQLYAERPGVAPISIKNVRANRSCPNPEFAQASSWPRPRSFDLGGATQIVQRVVCVGASSREFCSARGQNFIRTFAAEATVVDSTSPSVGAAQDSPLTRGQWVRGKQSFTYEASDNVGGIGGGSMNVPDNTAAGGPPSVGQTVAIRSRQYDVRLVDEEGGFYARFIPDDGSDPSDHYWPTGTDWTPWLPRVGQRAKLGRIVERFPHFSIAAGLVGTVTEATSDLIALTMDEPISGAEEWDNALCWSADDAAHYPGSPTERIAAAFYADVEPIDCFDGTAVFDCTDEQ